VSLAKKREGRRGGVVEVRRLQRRDLSGKKKGERGGKKKKDSPQKHWPVFEWSVEKERRGASLDIPLLLVPNGGKEKKKKKKKKGKGILLNVRTVPVNWTFSVKARREREGEKGRKRKGG